MMPEVRQGRLSFVRFDKHHSTSRILAIVVSGTNTSGTVSVPVGGHVDCKLDAASYKIYNVVQAKFERSPLFRFNCVFYYTRHVWIDEVLFVCR